MAGLAKPNGVKREVVPFDISGGGGYGSVASNLFDGKIGGFDTAFEWNNSTSYVNFSTSKPFNIWRSPSSGYETYQTSPLLILKYNENTSAYINITSQYTQIRTVIKYGEWEKTISNLPAGKYKFGYNGTLVDSEWYLESAINSIFLIQNGTDLCNTDGNVLSIIGSLPYTKDKFSTYGMDDTSLINPSIINKISNQKYNIALLK